jgi:RNA polymerase sigma-70 factor, ECF subfamily
MQVLPVTENNIAWQICHIFRSQIKYPMSFISIAFRLEDWYILSAISSMSYSSLSAEELVRACSESGNAEAWEEFVRRFRLVIGSAVRRIAYRYGKPNDAVVDDLIQDTYLKVCGDRCRMLRDFKPQHPDAFFGMLKVTAANIAHDYFRRQKAPKHGGEIIETELADVEAFVPDSRSGPTRTEREIQLREIDDILNGMATPSAARDREIFWLYYRQGFTADAIAAIPGCKLKTKGVESILHRLTCYVRARMAENDLKAPTPQARNKGIPPQNSFNESEGQL